MKYKNLFTLRDISTMATSLEYGIYNMENKSIPDYYPSYEFKQEQIKPLKEALEKCRLLLKLDKKSLL